MRGDRILLVRQVDHQEQCALMADAWGNPDFVRPQPFAPLREATSLHDEGWRTWEQRPEVSDQGLPVDFPGLDRETHIGLYTAGIETVCARGDRAGLIASLHGRGLYERRLGLDGAAPPRDRRLPYEREFIAQEVRRQQRLSAEIGLEDPLAPWAWSSYRLLQAWDALSLFLVWGGLPRGAEAVLPRVPRHRDDHLGVPIRLVPAGADTATLEPYPFAEGEVELPVAGRWIEHRRYADDDDLSATLEGSPWTTVDVRVTRP